MRRNQLLYILLPCLMVLLCGSGCQPVSSPPGSTASTLSASEASPEDLYGTAIQHTAQQNNLTMQVTYVEQMTVSGETFTSHITQTIHYQNLNNRSFRACISQSAAYGTYVSESKQFYADGQMYTQLAGKTFITDIRKNAFLDLFAPIKLLDASKYQSVTLDTAGTVAFSYATAREDWLVPTGAVLSDAYGSATVNTDGLLSQASYTASYAYGQASYHSSVNIIITPECTADIVIPKEQALQLDTPEPLFMLERALGHLLQTKFVASDITKSIVCQASGIIQNHTTGIHSFPAGNTYTMTVEQSVNQLNENAGNKETQYRLKETFQNGQYTYTENDGTAVPNDKLTAVDMGNYIHGLLSENILDIGYINGAATTELDGHYLVEFACDSTFGSALCAAASDALFDDPEFLDNMASAYAVEALTFHMTFDKHTRLPISLKTYYVGTHTIYETQYPLTVQIAQNFRFGT